MPDRLARTLFPGMILAITIGAPAVAQDVGPDSLLVLARRQLGNERLDSALTLYERVIAERPRSARAQRRGRCWRNLGCASGRGRVG